MKFYIRVIEKVALFKGNQSGFILAISLLILITIATRIPFMNWPLISDEGGYAYTAIWWFRGLTLYSDQLWLDRPQAIFLIYKLGLILFGNETWAIRFWGTLWAAGTSVLVFLIGYRLGNLQTALLAGGIFALYSGLPFIEGFTANAEVFAALFSTACVLFLLEGRTGTAGFLGSVAFLIKPSEASILVFAFVWIVMNYKGSQALISFLFWSMVAPLIAFIHGVISVGFNDYLYAVLWSRLALRKTLPISELLKNISHAAFVWAPLCLLTAFCVHQLDKKHIKFLFLWVLSAIFGMSIGGYWRWHYFIQIIPPLAIGSAFGLQYLSSRRPFGRSVSALFFVFPVIIYMFFVAIPPSVGSLVLYNRKGYQIADRVASYISINTSEDETIYIAFTEAEIYYLADRRSPYPYLFWIMVNHIPGAYDQIIEMIEDKVPTYILALDSPTVVGRTAESFMTPLTENYHIVHTFDGIHLYRRNE